MNNVIVFVESNTTGTGELMIRAAQALKLSPVLLTRDASRYNFSDKTAVETRIVDTKSEADLTAIVATIMGSRRIVGICSSSDYFIETASRMAGHIGLPGHDPKAIARCRDKGSQRHRLDEFHVPSPRWCIATDIDEATQFARLINGPVIVKPRCGSGSVGVRLAPDPDKAADAVATLIAAKATKHGLRTAPSVLIEEYIDGPEYSVETFDGNVIGITAKKLSAIPTFVEIGHEFPAVLTDEKSAQLSSVAQQAVAALDLSFGAVHVELRLGPTGPAIIEVNPRLAGGMIPVLVRLATGIDLIDATLRRASGDAVKLQETRRWRAGIQFLIASHDGVIARFDGLDVARSLAGIEEVAIYGNYPRIYNAQGDFRDRLGHVIAVSDSKTSPHRIAGNAVSLIKTIFQEGGHRD